MFNFQQIDGLCDEFVHQWSADQELSIEKFLQHGAFSREDELVNELIIQDVELRVSAGLSATKPEYEQRFPMHLDAIERAFRRVESGSRSILSHVQTVDERNGSAALFGSAEEAEIPKRLGEFEIIQRVGRGAFGTVFRGKNSSTDAIVALKFPRSKTLHSLQEFLQFRNEAELAQSLDHPAIVKSFGMRDENGFIFIVQQFVDGGTLEQCKGQFESTESVVKLMMALADAIGYAHKNGLIHRDLKPSNVLIDQESGNPLIADFGLSVHESFQRRLRGQRCGTPAYMSPEQVMGLTHQLDGRSDIWSLGVMLYELLAGRRPFRGSTDEELFEEVKLRNEKPLRMVRPELDQELQRICLKCLSKSIRDRYHSADELAQDLKNWLTYRDQWQSKTYVPLVPRGLRPFGPEDVEAFVELLPGPRNSLGVPESIQFWKVKLESFDSEHQLPIGVIFGPSGSGKSSYVRAGVIPHLDPSLIATTYVESTARDTEVRLIKSLRNRFTDIPNDVSLPEIVNGIRNRIWSGGSRRTLIVLDQFEQWIHGHVQFEASQLVQALRHCDGVNVSCILLIRDEYWLSTSRFLGYLGVDLRERENAQRIDRFEKDHAVMVLFLIGRALRKLPEEHSELSSQQIRFLEGVIDDLAEDDRVTSVHLTLFAEMFKNRDWSLKELRRIGGVSAVGTKFLEETFESKSTPPHFRRIKPDAQLILEELLPEVGINLKGHMQPLEVLKYAVGEDVEPARFERAINILNDELRLIVQTEPDQTKVTEDQETTGSNPKHFQLTHDYLVPSIRNWLDRDRKKSWQGRAALKLAELSGQWKTERETRFLPSLTDYLKIELGVPARKQTELQRGFVKSAGRMHLIRVGVTLSLATMLFFVIAWYRTNAQENKANELVRAYLTEPAEVASDRLDSLTAYPELAVSILRRELSDGDDETLLCAATGLCRLGFEKDASLEIAIDTLQHMTDEQEFAFVTSELRKNMVSANRLIISKFKATKAFECRTRLATAAMCLDEYWLAETIFDVDKDKTEATTVERLFETWLANQQNPVGLSKVANRILDECKVAEPNLLFHLLVAIRDMEVQMLDDDTQELWSEFLCTQYTDHPDAGIHSACWMLGNRWDFVELRGIVDPETVPPADRDWWHVEVGNGIAMTFVRIKPGSYLRGQNSLPDNPAQERYLKQEDVKILNEYWMASTEISFALLRQWRANQSVEETIERLTKIPGTSELMDSNSSVFGMSFVDSAQLVNWANKRAKLNDFQLLIPGPDQWEFACRAKSETMFPWGDDRVEQQLPKFAVVANSPYERTKDVISPSGSRVPNRFGIFDMIGNVPEYARQTDREREIQIKLERQKQKDPEQKIAPTPVAFVRGGGVTRNDTLHSSYAQSVPENIDLWLSGIRMILQKKDGEIKNGETDQAE